MQLHGRLGVEPDLDQEHERLAALFARASDKTKVVRERLAVVALNPVDRAKAYYQLALAQRDAGDRTEARRSILRALEVAPHFQRAQELLLDLRQAGAPRGTGGRNP